MARPLAALSVSVLLAMTACAGGSDASDEPTTDPVVPVSPSAADRSTTTVSETATTTTESVTAGSLIDWSARPVVFFSPLPPLPEGSDLPFGHGSDDFYELFQPGASWSTAADRVSVFLLESTYVRHYSTDDQLRAVIEGLDRLGIALGLEVGPLPAPPDGRCIGAEGFGGVYELDMVHRIEQLGGTVAVVAFDEPYAFGHRADGPDDCQRPVEQVATEVASFVSRLRSIEPDVVVGDIEPMWATPTIGADEMAAWLDAYEAAAGQPFGFLHLDSDWSRPDWAQVLLDVSAVARERGVPVGVIYYGGDVDSDEEWVRLSAQRMFEYEQLWGGTLDHVAFESWNDHPYKVLPETDVTAMTSLVNRYFGSRSSVTIESEAAEPGHAVVRASVLDESGVGIGGVPVSVEATPLDGAPQLGRSKVWFPMGA